MIEFKIFDEYSRNFKPEWYNLMDNIGNDPKFSRCGPKYQRWLMGQFLKQYNASIKFKNPDDWRDDSLHWGVITFETEQDLMFFKLRFA